MGDRSYKWRKVSRDLLTDERTFKLSSLALLLRVVLETMGDVDETQVVGGAPATGVGWLVDEYGDHYELDRIAALVHEGEEAVEAALRQLERARIAVRSDAGAWGSVGHEDRQLDPTTKRTRGWRARQAGNVMGTEPEHPGNDQTTDDRGQRTEDRINTDGDARAPAENPGPFPGISPVTVNASRPPPAPVDDTHPGQRLKLTRERHAWRLELAATRSGIPRGTLDKLERGSMQPTRAELAALAKAYGDPDLAALPAVDGDGGATIAEQVVREIHRHRVELELAQGDPPPIVAADVRVVFEPAEADRAAGRGLLATWLTVIRRAAEEIRRERARGKGRSEEFFRLEVLAGEKQRRKYLETPALDRREDLTPPARGSPRAPRITRERKYENRTHETPEETT